MQIVCKLQLMKATTAIILDTRKALRTGKYPVKLRVTFARKQKYFQTKLNLTKEEFQAIHAKNPKGQSKTWKLELAALEQRANEIISSLPYFDFELFEKKLQGNIKNQPNVYDLYDTVIGENTSTGNLGNASSYNSSRNSLKAYRPSLQFRNVTVEFLQGYERFLLEKECSVTTVGIYLRTLRAIINRALSEGIIGEGYNYPFGSRKKHKYQIPTSKNIKKALTIQEIELLFKYQAAPGSWEQKALDFWIFSYLANGMNMKDISLLRYKDIDGEFIRFVRAKSANTSAVVEPITVYLSDHLKGIIEKWGIDPEHKKPESRIFGIASASDTLAKQRADLQQFVKMVNKYIRIIAEKLGIQKPITTYYARHSFSTVLKRSGASIQEISEALGHKSISTTRSYLDGFEDGSKKQMAKALTNF